MNEYDHVRVERAEDVGRIVMDRPSTNNAMDRTMAGEMEGAAVELAEDDGVRCIVLTGTEGVFNTGADLTALEGDERDAPTLRRIAGALHGTISTLARAPKPVVCGVNGVAAGGGVGPALCGDLVLVAGSARFEFAYPRIGLSADGGSTFFLPRLVGLRRAQELAFRDEPVGAEEAAEAGLATEAVPDDGFEERLAEQAADLAAGPTRAYATTKALMRTSFDRSLDAQMAREGETLAALTATGDYARGIDAFFGEDEAGFEGA
jgi:2-(1,2-epoxy-1,2-dihydrophenyl)acetyl-CoA isomerase